MTLVAPERPAGAVVGTGAASADALLPWDGAWLGAVLGGGRADPATERRLADCTAALALSRSPELRTALEARLPRVVVHDPVPPADGDRHAAEWVLVAAAPLLDACGGAPLPELDPGPVAEREARALLAMLPPGFLALHPGSGSPRKNWPAERFAELARRLSADRPWLLVSGPADAAALATLSKAPGAVPARDLPLRTLAAVLRRAGLYVGNDSGVSHLAAAAGAPCLALFGPTPARVWRPLGRRADALEAPAGVLGALGVDRVEECARRLRRSHDIKERRPSGS